MEVRKKKEGIQMADIEMKTMKGKRVELKNITTTTKKSKERTPPRWEGG